MDLINVLNTWMKFLVESFFVRMWKFHLFFVFRTYTLTSTSELISNSSSISYVLLIVSNSKFNKLNLGHKKVSKSVRKHMGTESDTDSDCSDDVDLYSENFLSLVTRSGPVLLKRQEMFKKIFENGMPVQLNNVVCIMACGNVRNTILYPCRHMHLCKECWFLLKTYENEQIKKSTFEDDSDDSVTKPRCPNCRQRVESSDDVYL